MLRRADGCELPLCDRTALRRTIGSRTSSLGRSGGGEQVHAGFGVPSCADWHLDVSGPRPPTCFFRCRDGHCVFDVSCRCALRVVGSPSVLEWPRIRRVALSHGPCGVRRRAGFVSAEVLRQPLYDRVRAASVPSSPLSEVLRRFGATGVGPYCFSHSRLFSWRCCQDSASISRGTSWGSIRFTPSRSATALSFCTDGVCDDSWDGAGDSVDRLGR